MQGSAGGPSLRGIVIEAGLVDDSWTAASGRIGSGLATNKNEIHDFKQYKPNLGQIGNVIMHGISIGHKNAMPINYNEVYDFLTGSLGILGINAGAQAPVANNKVHDIYSVAGNTGLGGLPIGSGVDVTIIGIGAWSSVSGNDVWNIAGTANAIGISFHQSSYSPSPCVFSNKRIHDIYSISALGYEDHAYFGSAYGLNIQSNGCGIRNDAGVISVQDVFANKLAIGLNVASTNGAEIDNIDVQDVGGGGVILPDLDGGAFPIFSYHTTNTVFKNIDVSNVPSSSYQVPPGFTSGVTFYTGSAIGIALVGEVYPAFNENFDASNTFEDITIANINADPGIPGALASGLGVFFSNNNEFNDVNINGVACNAPYASTGLVLDGASGNMITDLQMTGIGGAVSVGVNFGLLDALDFLNFQTNNNWIIDSSFSGAGLSVFADTKSDNIFLNTQFDESKYLFEGANNAELLNAKYTVMWYADIFTLLEGTTTPIICAAAGDSVTALNSQGASYAPFNGGGKTTSPYGLFNGATQKMIEYKRAGTYVGDSKYVNSGDGTGIYLYNNYAFSVTCSGGYSLTNPSQTVDGNRRAQTFGNPSTGNPVILYLAGPPPAEPATCTITPNAVSFTPTSLYSASLGISCKDALGGDVGCGGVSWLVNPADTGKAEFEYNPDTVLHYIGQTTADDSGGFYAELSNAVTCPGSFTFTASGGGPGGPVGAHVSLDCPDLVYEGDSAFIQATVVGADGKRKCEGPLTATISPDPGVGGGTPLVGSISYRPDCPKATECTFSAIGDPCCCVFGTHYFKATDLTPDETYLVTVNGEVDGVTLKEEQCAFKVAKKEVATPDLHWAVVIAVGLLSSFIAFRRGNRTE
ncbi:MAG: hypothetical protein V1834_03185 [Candidatus Micrarchaeota archaeon]